MTYGMSGVFLPTKKGKKACDLKGQEKGWIQQGIHGIRDTIELVSNILKKNSISKITATTHLILGQKDS